MGAVRLEPGTMVIVLHEAVHLTEDDLHLVPEGAVVAVGEELPWGTLAGAKRPAGVLTGPR